MYDRVPPYWHDSGDVILKINDESLFCVHRCVLSVHSPVWKDMFQLGKQSIKQQLTAVVNDELPAVPLDDSVEDVCSLISAFYHGIDDVREKHDLDAALGVLKLSHKYQADRIYKAVFNLLLESWPLNRVDYFSLPEGKRQRVTSSIKLIKAARTTQSTALLPTAFYELAITPFEKWFMGDVDERRLLSDLSSEDLSRLFLGKSHIIYRYKSFTSELLEEHALSHYHCCDERPLFVREFTADFGVSSKLKSETDGVSCEGCRKWLFLCLNGLEEEIWSNIPEYFDLPLVKMGEDPFFRQVFS